MTIRNSMLVVAAPASSVRHLVSLTTRAGVGSLAALAVVVLSACGGGDDPTSSTPTPTSSTISAIALTAPTRMVEQGTATLSAQVTIGGTSRVASASEVQWTVSPSAAGSITGDGRLTALRPGSLTVEVTAVAAPSRKATRTIAVDSVAVTSVTLQALVGVVPGDTVRPQVVGRDSLGRDRLVTAVITSLDSVFVPAGVGAFRATQAGMGRLRAVRGTLTDEITIPVAVGSAQTLSLSAPLTLAVGESRMFAAPLVDRRGNRTATQPGLVVVSRDASVAQASVQGDSLRLLAVGAGQAFVRATRGSFTDSMQVTVTGPMLTELIVTPQGPFLDWARGLDVRVQTRNSLGEVVDVANGVTVQQITGESGLVGWQYSGGAMGRLVTQLLPFLPGGLRRDMGITTRLVFSHLALRDTVDVALHYRRPGGFIPLPSGLIRMSLGETVIIGMQIQDSLGVPMLPEDVLGVLVPPVVLGSPAAVVIVAPDSLRAVAVGLNQVRQDYQEGTSFGGATLTVEVTIPGGPPVGDTTAIITGYIETRPVEGLTAPQRAAVQQAMMRVENVISATPRDPFPLLASAGACVTSAPALNETVDGILIQLGVRLLDGPGGTLGGAGWCGARSGSQWRPVLGALLIDLADIDNMIANGTFVDVMAHEILHTLGIGTTWQLNGLSPEFSALGPDPRYTGAAGVAAYASLGGSGTVPVENVGGGGTAGAHWRESVFRSEVMSGFINPAPNPMSILTVASLGDIGYTVNLGAAEPYVLLGSAQAALLAEGPAPVPLREFLIKPSFIVHRDGRMERLP